MAPKRTPKDLSNAWPGALLGIYHGTEPSRQICRIPITFLTSCGVTDVRSVVRRIAEATVKEAVRIRDEQGRPFEDIDVLAIRSLFLYPLNPHGTLTIVELPASKSRLRVANLSPSESTFSNSTDASGRSGQKSFRFAVAVRDRVCLVTGLEAQDCTASHLAPVSRPDIYVGLGMIEKEDETQLYDRSYGILLASDVHRAYDQFAWSFFVEDGVYYVHYFAGKSFMRTHQGRVIVARKKWDEFPPEAYPDPILLKWHYQQCVIANFCVE